MGEKLLAQTAHPLGGFLEGLGIMGETSNVPSRVEFVGLFNKLISVTLGVMTVIVGIWFIFKVFIGAFGILSSGGDKANLEKARKDVTTGLIGLAVVIAGVFIISLIGEILGLPILTPGDFILSIWT